MYKLAKNKDGEIVSIVRQDGACIPIAHDNTDYQEYLKWVAEGNTPLPADGE